MLLELIATVVAGFGAAGVFLAVNFLLKKRLPRWLLPIVAGGAMLLLTISSEYTWFERTQGNLSENVVVALTSQTAMAWRPWTYLFPWTNRFIAVDINSVQRNQNAPNQRMVKLLLFARWTPIRQVAIIFNCADNQSTPIIEGAQFDDQGLIINPKWHPTNFDPQAIDRICSAP